MADRGTESPVVFRQSKTKGNPMITFLKNRKTGKYDLIGPAHELCGAGSVVVTKKDGTTTIVRVAKVTKSFVGKYGPLAGRQCRIGTVEHSRNGRNGNNIDDDLVRCRHCGQRTLEGDDWCMVCGQADYER